MIANLHLCLSKVKGYQINADAFTYHTANFRIDVIDDSFNRVGVKAISKQIQESVAFQEYLRETNPERELTKIRKEEAFFYLDDLAERRNEVAHGADSDVLSNSILLDYIAFAESFGNALFDVLQREIWLQEAQYCGIHLGTAISVIRNEIVCISNNKNAIKVGDILIAKTKNAASPFLIGEIQEIQINRVPTDAVAENVEVDVGIRVPFLAKANQ